MPISPDTCHLLFVSRPHLPPWAQPLAVGVSVLVSLASESMWQVAAEDQAACPLPGPSCPQGSQCRDPRTPYPEAPLPTMLTADLGVGFILPLPGGPWAPRLGLPPGPGAGGL